MKISEKTKILLQEVLSYLIFLVVCLGLSTLVSLPITNYKVHKLESAILERLEKVQEDNYKTKIIKETREITILNHKENNDTVKNLVVYEEHM